MLITWLYREAFIKKKYMENSVIGLTPPPILPKIMENLEKYYYDRFIR